MVHCIVLCLFYVTFRYARLDTSIVLTLHYTAQNMLAWRHNINRHREYSLSLSLSLSISVLSFYLLFSIKVTMLSAGGQSEIK